MKLEKIDGLTWKQLVTLMKGNCHVFALERDGNALEAAKVAMSHGPEAGAAVALAYRFLQKYGAGRTAWRAVHIYDRLSPHNQSIIRLKDLLCWVHGYSSQGKCEWPVKPMFRSHDKWGGLANIMMSVAADELSDGTTTDLLGATALRRFLGEGMESRRSKRIIEKEQGNLTCQQ